MVLKHNIEHIREIVKTYNRDITLIAASKTQTSETIDEFVKVAPDFILGENRVQELVSKYNPNYVWHMIGQLQANKVKYIIDKVQLIHSLDRVALADEIEKQATKHNKVMDCLIEINMGAEITKGGVSPSEVNTFIESMRNYSHINVKGVMAVLPNMEDKVALGNMYKDLYKIYEEAKKLDGGNVDIKYLSAGMTNDYEIALDNGSNMIRLGRVLFGERIYNANQV